MTGIVGMPINESRPGSIGVPFPDTLVAIFRPGELEEAPVGEEGEICVSGPAVMLGYLDDPGASAAALQAHPDGRTWLHTGDIGRMDEDGFFFFTSRLKRMIKSSGFNVFPSQVEAALHEHPGVPRSASSASRTPRRASGSSPWSCPRRSRLRGTSWRPS